MLDSLNILDSSFFGAKTVGRQTHLSNFRRMPRAILSPDHPVPIRRREQIPADTFSGYSVYYDYEIGVGRRTQCFCWGHRCRGGISTCHLNIVQVRIRVRVSIQVRAVHFRVILFRVFRIRARVTAVILSIFWI